MSRQARIWLGVLVSLVLAGCQTTEFKQYEGASVQQGSGGTKTVVDGVDIWDNGTPPRRYKVLGIVEDERSGGSLFMASQRSDIAKKARAAGGDAAILISNDSQIQGYVGNMSANTYGYRGSSSTYGSMNATAATRNFSKFAVIKYLD